MDHWQPETMSRARSLRQRFADSRSSASSSIASVPAARWQSQHNAKMVLDGLNCPATRFQPQQQSSTDSETMVASSSSSPRMSVRPTGSKSPSPSRAALAPPGMKTSEKRPTSVSWMVLSPRGATSRPATPSAAYPLDTSASMSAVPSQPAGQHEQPDEFVSDTIRDHSMLNAKVIMLMLLIELIFVLKFFPTRIKPTRIS